LRVNRYVNSSTFSDKSGGWKVDTMMKLATENLRDLSSLISKAKNTGITNIYLSSRILGNEENNPDSVKGLLKGIGAQVKSSGIKIVFITSPSYKEYCERILSLMRVDGEIRVE
jgi:hypothetical protein